MLSFCGAQGNLVQHRRGRVHDNRHKVNSSFQFHSRYTKGETTGMAILDVGVYTGYEPIKEDLENVSVPVDVLILWEGPPLRNA